MSIIERHPGWPKIREPAAHVLDQHQPEGAEDYWGWSQADALALELYNFLTIKQLVLRTRPTDNNNVDDPLSVSPGFLVDALWHAVLLESEASVCHAQLLLTRCACLLPGSSPVPTLPAVACIKCTSLHHGCSHDTYTRN